MVPPYLRDGFENRSRASWERYLTMLDRRNNSFWVFMAIFQHLRSKYTFEQFLTKGEKTGFSNFCWQKFDNFVFVFISSERTPKARHFALLFTRIGSQSLENEAKQDLKLEYVQRNAVLLRWTANTRICCISKLLLLRSPSSVNRFSRTVAQNDGLCEFFSTK